jgi:hypothetical protein
MRTWTQRPRIEATLLNPALFASLLSVAADGYASRSEVDMSWPLSFLVAPLVLHRPTREALPSRISTHLPTWLGREPVIRAGFPGRAQGLAPLTREGLRLGLRTGALQLEDGRLRGSLSIPDSEGDLRDILNSAHFVGRWLTKLHQQSSAFALLGVRP